jgi:hypothetical protein
MQSNEVWQSKSLHDHSLTADYTVTHYRLDSSFRREFEYLEHSNALQKLLRNYNNIIYFALVSRESPNLKPGGSIGIANAQASKKRITEQPIHAVILHEQCPSQGTPPNPTRSTESRSHRHMLGNKPRIRRR